MSKSISVKDLSMQKAPRKGAFVVSTNSLGRFQASTVDENFVNSLGGVQNFGVVVTNSSGTIKSNNDDLTNNGQDSVVVGNTIDIANQYNVVIGSDISVANDVLNNYNSILGRSVSIEGSLSFNNTIQGHNISIAPSGKNSQNTIILGNDIDIQTNSVNNCIIGNDISSAGTGTINKSIIMGSDITVSTNGNPTNNIILCMTGSYVLNNSNFVVISGGQSSSIVPGEKSVSIGYRAEALAEGSVAIGYGAYNTIPYSTVISSIRLAQGNSLMALNTDTFEISTANWGTEVGYSFTFTNLINVTNPATVNYRNIQAGRVGNLNRIVHLFYVTITYSTSNNNQIYQMDLTTSKIFNNVTFATGVLSTNYSESVYVTYPGGNTYITLQSFAPVSLPEPAPHTASGFIYIEEIL